MDFEPFLRMLLAAALTVPIGLERELRGKSAGLRTHVVVATASAALGYVSVLAAPDDLPGTDRTRIAAQVVSGIGFMGAGVIFAAGGKVHGLTTAAALWGASAIGLSVGLGAPMLGLALLVVTLLFLWPVDWISDRTIGDIAMQERSFRVVTAEVSGLVTVQEILAAERIQAREFDIARLGDHITVHMVIRCREAPARRLFALLADSDGVEFVSDEMLAPHQG